LGYGIELSCTFPNSSYHEDNLYTKNQNHGNANLRKSTVTIMIDIDIKKKLIKFRNTYMHEIIPNVAQPFMGSLSFSCA
jgi:hypothetical protein